MVAAPAAGLNELGASQRADEDVAGVTPPDYPTFRSQSAPPSRRHGEVAVFTRITEHRRGALALPDACDEETAELLEALLDPKEEGRLGGRTGASGTLDGAPPVMEHAWFDETDWDEIARGPADCAPEALIDALRPRRETAMSGAESEGGSMHAHRVVETLKNAGNFAKPTCFVCGQVGHVAANCPTSNPSPMAAQLASLQESMQEQDQERWLGAAFDEFD